MKRRLAATCTLVATAGIAVTVSAVPAHAGVLPRIPTSILIQSENVWYQSFARASESAPCIAPASLEIPWQADWPAGENTWSKSWAQWPNGGTGGWVCNRQITWSPAIYQNPVD